MLAVLTLNFLKLKLAYLVPIRSPVNKYLSLAL